MLPVQCHQAGQNPERVLGVLQSRRCEISPALWLPAITTPWRINIQRLTKLFSSFFRVCNRCKRELPISDFSSPASGIRPYCKKCDNEYSQWYHRTHPEQMRQYEKEYARKNPRRRWAISCLAGHRRRGYRVEMTSEELYLLASKTEQCFICQTPLNWELGNKGHMNNKSPTLDRLDNGNTIRSDNIRILCYQCNATKRDRTFEEFVDYCEEVCKKFHSHLE